MPCLTIAKGFSKTYGNVLQAINRLEYDATSNQMNFHLIAYTAKTILRRPLPPTHFCVR
jgi:hypothetical protein